MTPRQQRIADFIERYWEENWTSPSIREIGREIGLSSPSSVHVHLRAMVRKGILERKDVSEKRVLYRRHWSNDDR